mgnify:CR=1 FL=1
MPQRDGSCAAHAVGSDSEVRTQRCALSRTAVSRMAWTLESRFQTYLSYTQHSRPGCRCGSREVCGGLLTSLEGVPRVQPTSDMYGPLLSRYGTVTKNAVLKFRMAAMTAF